VRQRVRALLSVTAAALLLLSACTFVYRREYAIDAEQQISAAEQQQVFQAFRDFLRSKGLSPLSYRDKSEPNQVAYRIGGSTAGFALRGDFEDILELGYSGEDGFRLRLIRIIHHRADFSEEYLKRFVEQTEAFIREATARPVRIKLVPTSRT
jgi:hypothetical protein